MIRAIVTLKTGERRHGVALDEAGDLVSCGLAASIELYEDLSQVPAVVDTPMRAVGDVPRVVTGAARAAKAGRKR